MDIKDAKQIVREMRPHTKGSKEVGPANVELLREVAEHLIIEIEELRSWRKSLDSLAQRVSELEKRPVVSLGNL